MDDYLNQCSQGDDGRAALQRMKDFDDDKRNRESGAAIARAVEQVEEADADAETATAAANAEAAVAAVAAEGARARTAAENEQYDRMIGELSKGELRALELQTEVRLDKLREKAPRWVKKDLENRRAFYRERQMRKAFLSDRQHLLLGMSRLKMIGDIQRADALQNMASELRDREAASAASAAARLGREREAAQRRFASELASIF